MRIDAMRRHVTSAGFSLIEMLVALSLSIIVIALATAVLAVSVADGKREAARAELAREAAFAQTVLTQTLTASGSGVPRDELITAPGVRIYGGVLIAQAQATGVVADLPRPHANFNTAGPIAGRPAFTDSALAWTTANSGACMPGPGCPPAGDQSVLFPGDASTCTSDHTDRTCPWGLNRVMADDWLLIAAGDGTWTWGQAASPLSMSEAYGAGNGWFLDLNGAYNGTASLWPYDLAGPPLSTRGMGMVSTPDRIFFRLNGTNLQRKQCWGKPLPNDPDWPSGGINNMASVDPQDVGSGGDTDCFPAGAGWETLLTNVSALNFRYFRENGAEVLPASVTSAAVKESITRVEWAMTVERTVLSQRVYHELVGAADVRH
jgi:type II secretory pathway pseudopilin PulG